jgi:hypothetical protein
MKVAGREETAFVEIAAPGIPSEQVVHIVRVAWANAVVPGVSQNRIECFGWQRIDKPPLAWEPVPSRFSAPVIIWRQQRAVRP